MCSVYVHPLCVYVFVSVGKRYVSMCVRVCLHVSGMSVRGVCVYVGNWVYVVTFEVCIDGCMCMWYVERLWSMYSVRISSLPFFLNLWF